MGCLYGSNPRYIVPPVAPVFVQVPVFYADGSEIVIPSSPFDHRGILCWQCGELWIYHNDKDFGVCFQPLNAVLKGRGFDVVREPRTPEEQNMILARAPLPLGTPYDTLNWNCQHYVNFCYSGGGFSESVQLGESIVKGVGVGAGVFFLGKAVAEAFAPRPGRRRRV